MEWWKVPGWSLNFSGNDQVTMDESMGLSFPICRRGSWLGNGLHIPLSVTVSDCMTVPYRWCHLCLQVSLMDFSDVHQELQEGKWEGMQRSKKGDNRIGFLHILTWRHVMGSNFCGRPLTWVPTDLYQAFIATSVHLKEKKIVLNNSGKDAEEDYFLSQTQKYIFFLVLWINDSWNACILRNWMLFWLFSWNSPFLNSLWRPVINIHSHIAKWLWECPYAPVTFALEKFINK